MPYIQLRGKIVSYTTHGEGARRRLTALFSDRFGSHRARLVQRNTLYHRPLQTENGIYAFRETHSFQREIQHRPPRARPDRRSHRQHDRTTRILYHDRKNEKCFPQLESHTENGTYPSLRNTKPTARNIAPSHYLANATHEFAPMPNATFTFR